MPVQDKESSMGTNSYSIASKDSVEALYFPLDPPFYHAICGGDKKKPTRRAPVINKGYWLRIKAIEAVVEKFIRGQSISQLDSLNRGHHSGESSGSNRIKVVVNLGCGYDALPWRLRHKLLHSPEDASLNNLLFIDVDYPELLALKEELIKDPVFGQGPLEHIDCGGCHYNAYSDRWYAQIGVDLADVVQLAEGLDQILTRHADRTKNPNYDFLFVGEVSTTYMPTANADALFKWLATDLKKFFDAPFPLFDIGAIEICILEQVLPGGADHPFAKTMLEHFAKSAPLQSVSTYKTIRDQKSRFYQAGWLFANVMTLWDVWESHPDIVSLEDKQYATSVEPFDEWEEFVLFASHYAFILASTSQSDGTNGPVAQQPKYASLDIPIDNNIFAAPVNAVTGRCFGQAMAHEDGSINVVGGTQKLKALGSWTSRNHFIEECNASGPVSNVLCHTITKIYPDIFLLVGGRTSPTEPSSRVLLYCNKKKKWWATCEILPARYRHCAVQVTLQDGKLEEKGVLVFGGRDGKGNVLSDFQIFHHLLLEWKPVKSDQSIALFGAAMIADSTNSGYILGGIDEHENISGRVWKWILIHESDSSLRVTLNEMQVHPLAAKRIGCVGVDSIWGPLFVGGVGPVPLGRTQEMFLLRSDGSLIFLPTLAEKTAQRPLLTGMAVANTECGPVIIGGGGVCFSFGSYFNQLSYEVYALANTDPANADAGPYVVSGSHDDARLLTTLFKVPDVRPLYRGPNHHLPRYLPICEVHESRMEELAVNITQHRVPYALRGLNHFSPRTEDSNLNNCLDKWTLKYISQALGSEILSIHDCHTRFLQFAPKNFSYTTILGADLETVIKSPGSHTYLRALSPKGAFKKPANFWLDYPSLAQDFSIPKELVSQFNLHLPTDGSTGTSSIHSAVLRIAGDVSLWLHYDVMSNLWFQIRGKKRVVLFPPEDVAHRLEFKPGKTVSEIHMQQLVGLIMPKITGVEDERSNFMKKFQMTMATREAADCERAYVVELSPGEVLFIPRFWGHATFPEEPTAESGSTAPATVKASVAVNVFFKEQDLETNDFAPGKDVYGSKDLAVYELCRPVIQDIANQLNSADFDSEYKQSTARDIAKYLRTGRGNNFFESKKQIAILKRFENLPDDVRQFYLGRLGNELHRLCAQYRHPGQLLRHNDS